MKSREENVPSAAASSNDVKFEMMLKTMGKLMDKMNLDNIPFNREQNEPKIRNPNFRSPNRPPPPQIRQRDTRILEIQMINKYDHLFLKTMLQMKMRLNLLRIIYTILVTWIMKYTS